VSPLAQEVLTFALALLSGWALSRLALGPPARWSQKLLVASSGIALGLGIEGALGMVLRVTVGTRWELLPAGAAAVAIVAIAMLAACTARSPGRGPVEGTGRGGATAARTLFAVCAASAAAFAAEHLARYPEGQWDAWGIWNARARALLRAGSQWQLAFMPAEARAHVDYPILLPALVMRGWRAAGEGAAVPIGLSLAFAILLVVILCAAAAITKSEAGGWFAGACLLATPCFIGLGLNQYADLPVALFAFCAVACALLPGRGSMLLSGAFASLAALTKNDGLVHLAALVLCIVAVGVRRDDRLRARVRSVAWFATGAAPGLAILLAFKRMVPANDLVAQASLTDLLRRAADPSRLVILGREIGLHLIRFKDWGLFLAGTAVLWVILLAGRLKRPMPQPARLAISTAALSLGAFLTVLWLTPYDVEWHVRTAIDRLVLQCWPVLIFASVLALKPPAETESLFRADPAANKPDP
jgi:hypothetical protein